MSIVWLAFLTGLTTGGISCLAVQGGLLATAVAGGRKAVSIGMFILAKLLGYTLLGGLLGALGSMIALTPRTLGYLQIVAGLVMAATALRIIDAHPVFRYMVLTPPRWTYKFLRVTSQRQTLFAPALLGFFTILMPCGVTQATMALAVASGSPFTGAAIMFAFVLGTSPVFFVLGAAFVGFLQRRAFAFIAAIILLVFSGLSINGGIGLTGSPYTVQNLYKVATTPFEELVVQGQRAPIENGIQVVTIDVQNDGYQSSATLLKAGIPVRLIMRTHNTLGCSRAFTIPDLGIAKILPLSGEEVIEFTPSNTGRLSYSCSMGMYTGAFVIE